MTFTNAEKAMFTYKEIERRKKEKILVSKGKEKDFEDYQFKKRDRLKKMKKLQKTF